MRRHRRTIAAVQWALVALYALLVVVPALLPLPARDASALTSLTAFARFVFWGLWWPLVIVSVMAVGRLWCGVLCPEGTLTEFASRRGIGKKIPRWIRWSGWPAVGFVALTLHGQLIGVYAYPKPALLILGGSTLAAVAVGFAYGEGKRVWCRYLCPVTGVFELLARLSPIHFRVDPDAWKRSTSRAASVDCAPLLDLRRLWSASQCHACGRCSGHRGAIELAARSPNAEIVEPALGQSSRSAALLLVFGVLGVAPGAFQWTASPWFVELNQAVVTWLLGHGGSSLVDGGAPWWLLTHYPEAGEVYSWADGLSIAAYILGFGALAGGLAWTALAAAAAIAGGDRYDWSTLAMALVPVGGVGLFVGLSAGTPESLGADPAYAGAARQILIVAALAWSAFLGARIAWRSTARRARRIVAVALYAVPLALTGATWFMLLRVWGAEACCIGSRYGVLLQHFEAG